ncbi:hypothetical protein [Streptomyces sp. NPDC058583]|uniref:hypothetical protein n=1 Tax=unclassified Streptomyces TaxID=2593676 RepID=UPI00364EB2FE
MPHEVLSTRQEGRAALARAIVERDARGQGLVTPESAGLMPSYGTTLEEIVERDTRDRMTNHLALLPTSAKNWALIYQRRFGGVDPAWVAAQIFRSPHHGAILQPSKGDAPEIRVPLDEHVQLIREVLERESGLRLYDAAEGGRAIQVALTDESENWVGIADNSSEGESSEADVESMFETADESDETMRGAEREDGVDGDFAVRDLTALTPHELQLEVLREELTSEQLYLLAQPAQFNPLGRDVLPIDLGLDPAQWPPRRLAMLRGIGEMARSLLANYPSIIQDAQQPGPYRAVLKQVTEHFYRNRNTVGVGQTTIDLVKTLVDSYRQAPVPKPPGDAASGSAPTEQQLAEQAALLFYAPGLPGTMRPSLAAIARLLLPPQHIATLTDQAAAAWTHDLLMTHSLRYQRDFAAVNRIARREGDDTTVRLVPMVQAGRYDGILALEWTELVTRSQETPPTFQTVRRHDTAIRWQAASTAASAGHQAADDAVREALQHMDSGEQLSRTSNVHLVGVMEVNGLAGGDGMYPGATFEQMRTALRLASDARLEGSVPSPGQIARQVFGSSASAYGTFPPPGSRVGGWLRGRGLLGGGVPVNGSRAEFHRELHQRIAAAKGAGGPVDASSIAADLFKPLPLTEWHVELVQSEIDGLQPTPAITSHHQPAIAIHQWVWAPPSHPATQRQQHTDQLISLALDALHHGQNPLDAIYPPDTVLGPEAQSERIELVGILQAIGLGNTSPDPGHTVTREDIELALAEIRFLAHTSPGLSDNDLIRRAAQETDLHPSLIRGWARAAGYIDGPVPHDGTRYRLKDNTRLPGYPRSSDSSQTAPPSPLQATQSLSPDAQAALERPFEHVESTLGKLSSAAYEALAGTASVYTDEFNHLLPGVEKEQAHRERLRVEYALHLDMVAGRIAQAEETARGGLPRPVLAAEEVARTLGAARNALPRAGAVTNTTGIMPAQVDPVNISVPQERDEAGRQDLKHAASRTATEDERPQKIVRLTPVDQQTQEKDVSPSPHTSRTEVEDPVLVPAQLSRDAQDVLRRPLEEISRELGELPEDGYVSLTHAASAFTHNFNHRMPGLQGEQAYGERLRVEYALHLDRISGRADERAKADQEGRLGLMLVAEEVARALGAARGALHRADNPAGGTGPQASTSRIAHPERRNE